MTPEIAGAEAAGTIAARYRTGLASILSLGLSFDNNLASLVGPGITLEFQGESSTE